MSLPINTMKSMLAYAVYTLHNAKGSRKNMLRGIAENEEGYRIHMYSLSPYFCYDEAIEMNGRSVNIEENNYIISYDESGWFTLKLSSI